MEELLERVTYLEQVVSKLAKWTHFSEVVTFDSPAEVVISPERETDCSQNSKIPRRRRRRGGRRSSSSKVSPEVDDSSQLFTIKTEVELEEEMDFADDNDFAIFPKYPDQTGNDDAFPPPSQDEEESHDNTIVDELCDDDSENPQVRSLSPKFVWTPETDLFLLDQISQLKLLSLSGWKLNATWRKICANMSHQFQKEVTQIKVTGRFHLLLDQFNEQEPTPRKKYKPGDEHITAEINEKLEALSKLVQENEQKDQIATSSQQASENLDLSTLEVRTVLSYKGKQMLQVDGFLYQFAKSGVKKKIWRCDKFQSAQCLVRIHTSECPTNPKILYVGGTHTHSPDPGRCEARKLLSDIRLAASRGCEDDVSKFIEENVSSAAKVSLPRIDSIKRGIRRIRSRCQKSNIISELG